MDVYTFGLLVLWLVFAEDTLVSGNGPTVRVRDAFTGQDIVARSIFEELKHDGTLLDCTLQLVLQKSNLSDETRILLQKVFRLTLEYNPIKRAPDMQPFVDLLCKDNVLVFVKVSELLIVS